MKKSDNFFVTVPHSGRQIPKEAPWLKNLPPSVLYCDVDAFTDELYAPAIEKFKLKAVICPWHRYALDMNRYPSDINSTIVEGAASSNKSAEVSTAIHWHKTTQGDVLISKPLSKDLHEFLIEKYYYPFQEEILNEFKIRKEGGLQNIYQMDLHSMPSQARAIHKDEVGAKRADVVIGDRKGKSSRSEFTQLVKEAYERVGFSVSLNWPYQGGRITQEYGCPSKGQHTLQVELNRCLYMEESLGKKSDSFAKVQERLTEVMDFIVKNLKVL